jgi:hypothetical protein
MTVTPGILNVKPQLVGVPNSGDFSTVNNEIRNASLDSINSKIATEEKQDIGNSIILNINEKVSTSARQDIGNEILDKINDRVSTEAKQDVVIAGISRIDKKISTEEKQDIGNSIISSIENKIATSEKQDIGNVTLFGIDAKFSHALDTLERERSIKAKSRDLVDLNTPVTLTSTTETVVVSAIESVFNDVVEVNIDNSSTSSVRVDFRSVAAGAVVRSFQLPAGGSFHGCLSTPWKQATKNTAWTAQLSASVNDVRISLGTIRNT